MTHLPKLKLIADELHREFRIETEGDRTVAVPQFTRSHKAATWDDKKLHPMVLLKQVSTEYDRAILRSMVKGPEMYELIKRMLEANVIYLEDEMKALVAYIDGDKDPTQDKAAMRKYLTEQHGIRFDADVGVDTLTHFQLHNLSQAAHHYGYKKPRSASGSLGRYFFEYLKKGT